jgi:quercetin dioxygenase-like cupin family protein
MKPCIHICFLTLFLTLPCAFSAPAKGPQIEVQKLADTQTSWDGSELPAYPQGQPRIQILNITIPAGKKLALHRHPVINAGILLGGELRVHTENGKILHLKAGEAIVEVVNTWHWGESVGDDPARIVVFYAGTNDLVITEYKD